MPRPSLTALRLLLLAALALALALATTQAAASIPTQSAWTGAYDVALQGPALAACVLGNAPALCCPAAGGVLLAASADATGAVFVSLPLDAVLAHAALPEAACASVAALQGAVSVASAAAGAQLALGNVVYAFVYDPTRAQIAVLANGVQIALAARRALPPPALAPWAGIYSFLPGATASGTTPCVPVAGESAATTAARGQCCCASQMSVAQDGARVALSLAVDASAPGCGGVANVAFGTTLPGSGAAVPATIAPITVGPASLAATVIAAAAQIALAPTAASVDSSSTVALCAMVVYAPVANLAAIVAPIVVIVLALAAGLAVGLIMHRRRLRRLDAARNTDRTVPLIAADEGESATAAARARASDGADATLGEAGDDDEATRV